MPSLNFCFKVLWSEETKTELFGHNDKVYLEKIRLSGLRPVPAVRHGGVIMLLGGFTELEYLKFFNFKRHSWVFLDNDPKHIKTSSGMDKTNEHLVAT